MIFGDNLKSRILKKERHEKCVSYNFDGISGLTCFSPANLVAQQRGNRHDQGIPTLGIEKGTMECKTPMFQLELLNSTQTVASLKTNDDNPFGFTPGDNLVLRFEVTNKSDKPVEIGALGIPMIFNNNFNGKSLDQAHAENVFFDPYIGADAGYLQVIRLDGNGMARDSSVTLLTPQHSWFIIMNSALLWRKLHSEGKMGENGDHYCSPIEVICCPCRSLAYT